MLNSKTSSNTLEFISPKSYPRAMKKTSAMLDVLIMFDREHEKKSTISNLERNAISDLHTFTNKEIDRLITLYEGSLSCPGSATASTSFWQIIGAHAPLLKLSSTLQQRLNEIFLEGTQCPVINFILSIAVLCDKSTVITRASLICDVFFRQKNTIGIPDVEELFGDLPTSGKDMLFLVDSNGTIVDITRGLFITGWCRLIRQLGGEVTREVLEPVLETHVSSSVLLFPLSMSLS